MKVGILGAGFGLYGYLPALVLGCGADVVLPSCYRAAVDARDDIRHLVEAIEWVEDAGAVMGRVEVLVVSQRPSDQAANIDRILGSSQLKKVLLEKPLACHPQQAAYILRRLTDSGRDLRIGYTFRYTSWAEQLRAALKNKGPDTVLQISWVFHAHHYAADLRNWKRQVSAGGGALRFYGIHLIALLAEFGYREVLFSMTSARLDDEAKSWEAILTGDGLPNCDIRVVTDAAESRFDVRMLGSEILVISLRGPFDEYEAIGGLDRRVGLLSKLCHDLFNGVPPFYSWYESAIFLWNRIEAQNRSLRTTS